MASIAQTWHARKLELLLEQLDDSQFLRVCVLLKVDIDSLKGETRTQRIQDLVSRMQMQDAAKKLEDAIWYARGTFPDGTPIMHGSPYLIQTGLGETASTAFAVSDTVHSIRQQLAEIQEEPGAGPEVRGKLAGVVETVDRAVQQSSQLTASIRLPPPEMMEVHLVPSHLLERLEEYRTDNNWAFLAAGAFLGAVLGVLVNWATSGGGAITGFSVVLLILFGVLAVASGAWALVLRARAESVKRRLMEQGPPDRA